MADPLYPKVYYCPRCDRPYATKQLMDEHIEREKQYREDIPSFETDED